MFWGKGLAFYLPPAYLLVAPIGGLEFAPGLAEPLAGAALVSAVVSFPPHPTRPATKTALAKIKVIAFDGFLTVFMFRCPPARIRSKTNTGPRDIAPICGMKFESDTTKLVSPFSATAKMFELWRIGLHLKLVPSRQQS